VLSSETDSDDLELATISSLMHPLEKVSLKFPVRDFVVGKASAILSLGLAIPYLKVTAND
jgi:hypothetical protein